MPSAGTRLAQRPRPGRPHKRVHIDTCGASSDPHRDFPKRNPGGVGGGGVQARTGVGGRKEEEEVIMNKKHRAVLA